MSARFAMIAAAVCAAAAGGALLRHRRPEPLPDLGQAALRLGRAAARNVSDDWDALFI